MLDAQVRMRENGGDRLVKEEGGERGTPRPHTREGHAQLYPGCADDLSPSHPYPAERGGRATHNVTD